MINLQVIGHLGKDCVVNAVNGKNVINFNVAHSEKFKDHQGNQVDKTTWVNCAYWTDRTGIAPYLKKGQLVFVTGTPEVKQFTKNDGGAGVSLNCRVNKIDLLGGKKEGGESEQETHGQPGGYSPASDITEPVDDLPF